MRPGRPPPPLPPAPVPPKGVASPMVPTASTSSRDLPPARQATDSRCTETPAPLPVSGSPRRASACGPRPVFTWLSPLPRCAHLCTRRSTLYKDASHSGGGPTPVASFSLELQTRAHSESLGDSLTRNSHPSLFL